MMENQPKKAENDGKQLKKTENRSIFGQNGLDFEFKAFPWSDRAEKFFWPPKKIEKFLKNF